MATLRFLIAPHRLLYIRTFAQTVVLAAMVACRCWTAARAEMVAIRYVMPVVTGDQTDLEILPKPKVEAHSGRALRIERGAVELSAFADSPADRGPKLPL